MKKFIVTNIILLLLFLIISFSLNHHISQNLEKEFVGEFEVFDLDNDSYDFINVGTSHGSFSFDWKSLDLNGLNLAQSNQPLIEDLFLLEKHERYFNDGSIIVLPISFHSFCMEQELSAKTKTLYLDNVKLLGMVRTDRIIRYMFDQKDGEYPSDAFDFERFSPEIIKPSNCSQEHTEKVIDVIDEIIESYSNVVLVTTPYYYESLNDYDSFQSFYKTVETISDRHNLEYFDYSRDPRFHDTKYFINNTHLNSLGRLMFTEYFYNEVLNTTN